MYTELALKMWSQSMQPIEAYPVLFYYTRPYSWFSYLAKRKMQKELDSNTFYKN